MRALASPVGSTGLAEVNRSSVHNVLVAPYHPDSGHWFITNACVKRLVGSGATQSFVKADRVNIVGKHPKVHLAARVNFSQPIHRIESQLFANAAALLP